jgi:hypothetical protein
MNLLDRFALGQDRRNHWALKRPSGHHHSAGFYGTRGCADGKTRAADIALDRADFNAGSNRRVEFAGVGLQVLCNLLLGHKGVGRVSGKLQTRKAVMPSRPIADQRVPSFRAPALGNALALEYQVGNL